MAVEKTAPARVVVQGRAWVLERDGRLIWLELRGEEGSRNELQAHKKAGLCCPLSADKGSEVVGDRDRHGPDDLSAKDITLAVV